MVRRYYPSSSCLGTFLLPEMKALWVSGCLENAMVLMGLRPLPTTMLKSPLELPIWWERCGKGYKNMWSSLDRFRLKVAPGHSRVDIIIIAGTIKDSLKKFNTRKKLRHES
jgi:hypothetical protein